MRILLLLILACSYQANKLNAADPIHVLVWDERQPRQKVAYENFLGNEIIAQLKATTTDLNPQGFKDAADFLEQYRSMWEESLDRLGSYLDSVKSKDKQTKKNKSNGRKK